MADTKWTPAQLQAIDTQGNNILVSAAAGSGKTAVLVERVIRMITRETDPLDLDRLVIVTFTRAAAAQMKNKIFKAIREKLRSNPGDGRLSEQMMKVMSARICTIDSLCLNIVRENIQDTDLDPEFRMADEAQLDVLKQDVLKAMLEDCYEQADKEFMDFVRYYTDKNDSKLEDIILTLYSFAQSHPEPLVWLRSLPYPYLEAKTMCIGTEEFRYPDGYHSWMDYFAQTVNERMSEIKRLACSGLSMTKIPGGLYFYEDLFQDIIDFTDSLEGQSFDFRRLSIRDFLDAWPSAPRTPKGEAVDEELKAGTMDIRREIKKRLGDLLDDYLYDDLENIFHDMASCADVAQTISRLTIRFSEEYEEAKKKKQIADFSDIAHYALKILIRYNDRGEIERGPGNEPLYTQTADHMARLTDQVIVDEYQDTNMLQEYVVKALSGTRFGRPDIFMVGDVKQSIYSFRMACPDLFNQKLDTYSTLQETGAAEGIRIILDRNFRSRKEVLDFANLVFGRVMIREIGDIAYSDGHSLVYGGKYGTEEQERESSEECQEKQKNSFLPEVLMIRAAGEQAKSLEAYAIAARIEKLVSEEGFSYSDIVILTRTTDNPVIERILSERAIPIIKNSGQGFFACFEIRLILDLLTVIDNPFQDIPFTAVLYSPLCSLSSQDLAAIRLSGDRHDSMYECLEKYCSAKACDSEKARMLSDLLKKIAHWRQTAFHMGVYDLMERVLAESGLDNIFRAMPQGPVRNANVEMLKAKAADFSRGSFAGLFEFLQYMKSLRSAGFDFGSRNVRDTGTDAVRMMTIHKSKGLEFPVVFIAGCGKKYNDTDLNSGIIPDRKLGVGLEKRDPESRIIRKTAFMQTVRQKKRKDLYAEELRLFYVAMTRAEEKLIITGTDRNLESKIRSWEQQPAQKERDSVEAYEILHAGSFLSILGAAVYKYRGPDAGFTLRVVDETDVEGERASRVINNIAAIETLTQEMGNTRDISDISDMLGYEYPYLKAAYTWAKIPVSALEKKDTDISDIPFAPLEKSEDPDFDSDRLFGKDKGNAYHKFMELMDYSSDLEEQKHSLINDGLLDRVQADAVNSERITAFLDSELGKRMKAAHEKGRLYREKQFVMGTYMDISKLDTVTGVKYNSDSEDYEYLLVQGIIDAYFTETDDEGREYIVLVDYKTDRALDENYYKDKYAPQLNEYANALTRSTRLQVREKYVYSFELGRQISID